MEPKGVSFHVYHNFYF